MKRRMRKFSIGIIVLVIMLSVALTPALAKGGGFVTHTREVMPIYGYGFLSCGGSEFVSYSGNLNIVSHVSENNGKYHYNYHINGQGLNGSGWYGGTEYQVIYINDGQKNVDYDSLPAVNHSSIMLFFVSKGQGGASNFLLEMDVHSTINANGEVTSEMDRSNFTCK